MWYNPITQTDKQDTKLEAATAASTTASGMEGAELLPFTPTSQLATESNIFVRPKKQNTNPDSIEPNELIEFSKNYVLGRGESPRGHR